jgi:hypothetical protein
MFAEMTIPCLFTDSRGRAPAALLPTASKASGHLSIRMLRYMYCG